MFNILQYTNNFKSTQLFHKLFKFYKLESKTLKDKIIEIILKAGITFLVAIFAVGWTTLVFELITNPYRFNNASFGIFDYI